MPQVFTCGQAQGKRLPRAEKLLEVWWCTSFGQLQKAAKAESWKIVVETKGDGPSLNQFLDPGSNLVPDILDVLMRWRMAPVVFSADIEQAFYQIELEPEDSHLIRFLWMDTEGSERVQMYRFKRAVMGLACSPFMLQAVIRKLLEEYQDRYPEAVELILKQLFVDDLMGCADTVDKAKELIKTIL